MKGRISYKNIIKRQLSRLRKRVKINTQRIRTTTLFSLEDIFNIAVSLAKGEVKTQVIDGKQVKVTLKERQMWARIAAYTAQIMNSVASGFDERQIDVDLAKLQRLVDEAKAKARDDAAGKGAKTTKPTEDAQAQG